MQRWQRYLLAGFALAWGLWCAGGRALAGDALAAGFVSPGDDARPWVYWWWLNGTASKEGITRDFEEMKAKGIGGALLFDAGQGGEDVGHGPAFMSDGWRELFKHALHEAQRCGIVLTVNLCTGWDCGGPWITAEHAAKKLTWARTKAQGPGHVSLSLPMPPNVQGYYRDIAVLASPVGAGEESAGELVASSSQRDYPPSLARDGDDETRWVSSGTKPGMGPTAQKPEYLQFDFAEAHAAAAVWIKPYSECGPQETEVQWSEDGIAFQTLKRVTLKPAGEQTIAFDETRAKHFRIVFLSAYPFRQRGSWNVQVSEIELLPKDQVGRKRVARSAAWNPAAAVDVTKSVDANGQLNWDVPPGTWRILRIGYTLHGLNTVVAGSGPAGPELDPMSRDAMDVHFAATGAKLLADAGPLAGKTLQYFHIDSWEIGQPNWTPRMREEFRRRRGYDLVGWLPALAGETVVDAAQTQRFVQDYRRTVADLVAENYYGRLAELSVKGGLLGTHSESGGPNHSWIDALQCEGKNDVPMGEFWNRITQPDGPVVLYGNHNFTVKQAATAAHIYGRRVCQAEAFTSLADDFTEDPWCLKDIGDAAFCDGLTRMVFHNWPTQTRPDARPRYWWVHIGVHFGYKLTWWPMADGWLKYLARCQHMLRQGLFVADFAYLQDDAIPNFVVRRKDQSPARPAGFDYDAMNAEALLSRASAKDGRLTLPDGMSYRYLVLPHQPNAIVSAAALRKVNELANAGVAVIGPKHLASAVGKMRVGPLAEVTGADGVLPDIEFRDASRGADFDWIHRRDGETEIYFISNQTACDASARVVFRVTGKQPELWDAVTGTIRDLPQWSQEGARSVVPLEFAPRQSWFVVFRKEGAPSEDQSARNFAPAVNGIDLAGPWEVRFDPKWGGPQSVMFEKLEDWTRRPEEGIRYYSGIATYRTTFKCPSPRADARIHLSLGTVKNVARVRLNGRDLGAVWTAPWEVDITDALREDNALEIDVANLWPNRLIADAALPAERRLTTSNILTYEPVLAEQWLSCCQWARNKCPICQERLKTGRGPALLPSGLIGPVTLREYKLHVER